MKRTGSPGPSRDRAPVHQDRGEAEPEPIDLGRAARQAGGDPGLLAEVLSLLAEESSSILATVRAAARRGDLDAVERAAHALKGSASNVAADPLAKAAGALQRAAREGRTDEMGALIARLAHEAERFHAFRASVQA